MANSTERTVQVATSCSVLSEQVVDLYTKINDFLEYNSDQAIDWAAGSTPAYIPEDADGNIDGLQFSRQAVANAIGSLDQLRSLMTNQAAAQGDHLGNLNVVSHDPL